MKAKTVSLGILGGGQLALMLGEALASVSAALKTPTHLRFLTEDALPPVRRLNDATSYETAIHPEIHSAEIHPGSDRSPKDLRSFFQELDWIWFENEFVNVPLLREVAREFPRLQFFPKLDAIELFQDKLNQKRKWAELGLPAPAFHAPAFPEINAAGIQAVLNECQVNLGDRFVLKWSRQGYDGKGVTFVDLREQDSLSAAAALLDFFIRAKAQGSELFAETFVPYLSELAVIGCGNDQSFFAYPVVETIPFRGTCQWVRGPFAEKEDSPLNRAERVQIAAEIQKAAEQIARSCHLEGSFGLEVFLLRKEDRLTWMINEIAPRVHNSGHYTQDLGDGFSQFEAHARACFKLPIASPPLAGKHFGMLNLLGAESVSGTLPATFADSLRNQLPSHAVLHWYGKNKTTPRRKLGHINWCAPNAEQSDRIESALRTFYTSFHHTLTKEITA